jgi:hypothetical protein
MSFYKKNLKVLTLALALPSSILGVAILLMQLVKNEVINKNIALIFLVLIVFNTLYLMIRYVTKRKN